MNIESFERAKQIADAVLVEGYVLYPYRASSAKNQYRWTFGVVAPRAWSDATHGESSSIEAQVIVKGRGQMTGRLRFLRVVTRAVEARDGESFRGVAELKTGMRLCLPWEEGEVCEIDFQCALDVPTPRSFPIALAARRDMETITDAAGECVGRFVRTSVALAGNIFVAIDSIGEYTRVTVRVENETPFDHHDAPRAEAIRAALVSTHLLLSCDAATFASLVDPPDDARGAVASLRNTGTWPVLTDEHTMLCAPIILSDLPQIAPESPLDFCDGGEIDELLTLRTMTLTPEEKVMARATDERAARIVDRVESMTHEERARLHGAIRDKPRLRPGAHVRISLSPRRTDAQDLLYRGARATIEQVKRDVDGRDCFAVTFDDDPAAELHRWYGRFHYYYADEIEPIEGEP